MHVKAAKSYGFTANPSSSAIRFPAHVSGLPASKRLITAVKRRIPESLHPPLRSIYHAVYRNLLPLHWWILERFEKPTQPLPPPKLRFRVAEDASASRFVSVGQRTADDLHRALENSGFKLEDGAAALDFGCGCGRTLVWLAKQFPAVRWHGTDVDAEAVLWCQRNIPGAAFTVNRPLPPLPHADHSFDLIYGISVFTHLSKEYQLAWVQELYRILKPGGLLLLTFYAQHVWESLDETRAVERDEFVFQTSTKMKGILPDWYQTAFQSQSQTIAMLSAHYAEVTCLERGFGDQDVIAARK